MNNDSQAVDLYATLLSHVIEIVVMTATVIRIELRKYRLNKQNYNHAMIMQQNLEKSEYASEMLEMLTRKDELLIVPSFNTAKMIYIAKICENFKVIHAIFKKSKKKYRDLIKTESNGKFRLPVAGPILSGVKPDNRESKVSKRVREDIKRLKETIRSRDEEAFHSIEGRLDLLSENISTSSIILFYQFDFFNFSPRCDIKWRRFIAK